MQSDTQPLLVLNLRVNVDQSAPLPTAWYDWKVPMDQATKMNCFTTRSRGCDSPERLDLDVADIPTTQQELSVYNVNCSNHCIVTMALCVNITKYGLATMQHSQWRLFFVEALSINTTTLRSLLWPNNSFFVAALRSRRNRWKIDRYCTDVYLNIL